jgi:hypothetical protein
VPVPQRQTWYGAVAKNFLPALGAGLAAGLIAFAITGLLALIAFFTGAAVLGVTGAIGVVLFAAAASALSAFLAKLIIAAIAHPDAAIDNQPKPPSQMEVRAGTVAGERKAKIIFRRSDSDLERERKLGAGENDSGNWNIDIFNVVSGSIDPRYVDHRYYLFRFDDPTLPLIRFRCPSPRVSRTIMNISSSWCPRRLFSRGTTGSGSSPCSSIGGCGPR